MLDTLLDWIVTDKNLEWISAILGFLYIFCSIREHILTWFFGVLTSALYIYVFFVNKFYADMSLQVYYVIISVYGWYMWTKKSKSNGEKSDISIRYTTRKEWLYIIVSSLVLYVGIWYLLAYHTDSPVPKVDAFTTAFGIVATWMMTKKLIEQWLFWVVIDLVAAIAYFYKDMTPTVLLMSTYTVLAAVGFYQWKRLMTKQNSAANV
ncbi:nicotinamide riboside transporter PnuC [Halosquirtibacter xylanolyticus]|uniref:nicotinamide riboside transporter PnuC n=1 Tax=Halosquirtibacter xylanolyticus TaxID=3374599 RepID=UPI003748213F|nr:nicotinamide riboside transporter PnuC [Prolixibacteraceae bacterium]